MNIILKIVLSLFMSFCCLNLAIAGNWNKSEKQGVLKNKIYKDTDWTHKFRAGNGFPSNSKDKWNVRWQEEDKTKFLRFRLFNGQIGNGHTDNKRRNRAPYWERAEISLKRPLLSFFKSYEIEFKIRFVKGFDNYRETFFQYKTKGDNCPPYSKNPPFMLKFQDNILYFFYALNKNAFNHLTFYPEIDVTKIYNKWVKFKLIITPTKFQDVHKGGIDLILFFEGEELWSQSMIWTSNCGKPYLRLGIYRPGNEKEVLETSVIDYDYIKIKEIKN